MGWVNDKGMVKNFLAAGSQSDATQAGEAAEASLS
jgi:hypothetical protein